VRVQGKEYVTYWLLDRRFHKRRGDGSLNASGSRSFVPIVHVEKLEEATRLHTVELLAEDDHTNALPQTGEFMVVVDVINEVRKLTIIRGTVGQSLVRSAWGWRRYCGRVPVDCVRNGMACDKRTGIHSDIAEMIFGRRLGMSGVADIEADRGSVALPRLTQCSESDVCDNGGQYEIASC
jgi:hypothetical protein